MEDARQIAESVLDANWDGRSTRPAPRLYPHQWSWDSAFIAIGNAYRRPDRAVTELTSLFAAQWANGMVPHIVFSEGSGAYFPSPEWWRSDTCPDASTGIQTPGGQQSGAESEPKRHPPGLATQEHDRLR